MGVQRSVRVEEEQAEWSCWIVNDSPRLKGWRELGYVVCKM